MDSLRNTLAKGSSFLGLYIAVAAPTYILPYFGSNSIIAGAATAGATLPQFLIHLACLIALCVFAHVRGKIIGKGWLISMPILAAIFDMVPLLNWIPLVPTAFHAVALVVGANDPEPGNPDVFS